MLMIAGSSVDDLQLEIAYMRKQQGLKREEEKLKNVQAVCQSDEKTVRKEKMNVAFLSKKRGR